MSLWPVCAVANNDGPAHFSQPWTRFARAYWLCDYTAFMEGNGLYATLMPRGNPQAN